MAFGENLQEFRKQNSISQEKLAEMLNVSRQSISKWEINAGYPEMKNLMQLCTIFGCTLDILINGNVNVSNNSKLKLLLMCGGPGAERNISLNSARSVYDTLVGIPNIETSIVFVSSNLQKYEITGEFLYSNTTSDFDFKLSAEGKKLSNTAFLSLCQSIDLVFPIIHGKYGEDGEIQAFFERFNIPFIASGSVACNKMYNKWSADELVLKANNITTVPKIQVLSNDKDYKKRLTEFFEQVNDVIIKPIEGGSSFGVKYAQNLELAIEILEDYMKSGIDALVERRCYGREFTVIIMQDAKEAPIAFIPTEIEIKDETKFIFDTRRKYLATNETHYYCPPRFTDGEITNIREKAQLLFNTVGAADFVRIDGWIFNDGRIYFSDFNPISGMEQNSFIFQQGAKIGLTHQELIAYIINNACKRYGLPHNISIPKKDGSKRVNVIFGGITSERQVSLLSGSNVWLKLTNGKEYNPYPYLLFKENGEYCVLKLPYARVLNHTTEEIMHQYKFNYTSDFLKRTIADIRKNLGLGELEIEEFEKYTLDEFLDDSKKQNAFVFLGLHGGFGEGGDFQEILESKGLKFNGPGSIAAKVCMDKALTGKKVDDLKLNGIRSCKKILLSLSEIKALANEKKCKELWAKVSKEIGETVIIKPNADGCSTGVIVIDSGEKLCEYAKLVKSGAEHIKKGTFKMQDTKVALSTEPNDYLIEEYIKVDKIEIKNAELVIPKKLGWVELTCGVLEKQGEYHALNPSITIADSGAILSVEEKFQGGTGVNITPPPENILSNECTAKIKKALEKVAKAINIENYCRIDIFANAQTNEIIVIEINTLPGLSPSTVLFQQAAKEATPIMPIEFLENLVKAAGKK